MPAQSRWEQAAPREGKGAAQGVTAFKELLVALFALEELFQQFPSKLFHDLHPVQKLPIKPSPMYGYLQKEFIIYEAFQLPKSHDSLSSELTANHPQKLISLLANTCNISRLMLALTPHRSNTKPILSFHLYASFVSIISNWA